MDLNILKFLGIICVSLLLKLFMVFLLIGVFMFLILVWGMYFGIVKR